MPADISTPLQSSNHGLIPDFSQRTWPSLSAEQDHLQDAASGRKAAGAAHLEQVRQEGEANFLRHRVYVQDPCPQLLPFGVAALHTHICLQPGSKGLGEQWSMYEADMVSKRGQQTLARGRDSIQLLQIMYACNWSGSDW